MSLEQIIELRRELHSQPELSGEELHTAERIAAHFRSLKPDQSISGLGGHGMAFVFEGDRPGPTVLLRCDMDALPIRESNDLDYRSQHEGVAHQCGHDGHMAIIAAVGESLARQRPASGRVVLLYQPAEETGRGAAAVVADHQFEQIRPDLAFALHNLPGYPLGQVVVRAGAFNCASRGMSISLTGRTAHAAQPETGNSPAAAMVELLTGLESLPGELVPDGELGFVTVVGASLGKKAFGTAPGQAHIWATLRSESDSSMERIVAYAESMAREVVEARGLGLDIDYEDVFPATVNAPKAVDIVLEAARGLSVVQPEGPFRWSEDFGRIAARCEGALFGLGAGETVADLHNPDYDFPDALIQPARDLFLNIVAACTA